MHVGWQKFCADSVRGTKTLLEQCIVPIFPPTTLVVGEVQVNAGGGGAINIIHSSRPMTLVTAGLALTHRLLGVFFCVFYSCKVPRKRRGLLVRSIV